ncbi:MAG: hypothetical protein IJD48_00465 [Clostridia bacterium]|nr:hypothetical protein [Clostridia bacterium]
MKKNYKEDLIEEVKQDFLKRQKERKSFENIWRLNSNFYMGNQYSSINSLGDIEEYDKKFFWQEREVFNHIAPIIEARLSKLSTVRPKMNVLPVSAEENDLKVAKLSSDILKGAYQKLELNKLIINATEWSEITGTSFYKIVWNSNLGKAVYLDDKSKIREGEIEVCVVPPYEIFPDSSSCSGLEDCASLIHAKAYSVKDIKNIWGVDVEGKDVDVFSLGQVGNVGGLGYRGQTSAVENSIKHNQAIVIERYEAPSSEFKNGRLIIVCEDKLLFCGDLPYVNLFEEKRGFPFVRQVSINEPGCFWGTSVIQRIIPIQRSYNAVKNRKHECLNRLSMGVLTVEDGSVDIENLEEEGLSPGKVLIYRQGSNAPKMMECEQLPTDFDSEEEKLLSEFAEIGGVSGLVSSSTWSRNLSGTALELLLEQDRTKLNITSDNIKNAVKELARHILKLYKQFAVTPRLFKISNSNGKTDVIYWKNSDITSNEIVLDTQSELGESLSVKRDQILKLMSAGLLQDDNGKMSSALRVKILELFGLGVWEGSTDEDVLQKNYADRENLLLISNRELVEVCEIDNHDIHISRHISFMLENEFFELKQKNPLIKDVFLSHIRQHKQSIKGE